MTRPVSKKRKFSDGDGHEVNTRASESIQGDGDGKNNPQQTLSLSMGDVNDLEVAPAPLKSKRQRKAEKKARHATQAARIAQTDDDQHNTLPSSAKDTNNTGIFNPNDNYEAMPSLEEETQRPHKRKLAGRSDKATNTNSKSGSTRFIVFIGNLPFSATTRSIEEHFAAVKPKSVRHLTHKDQPSKSKGYAFVEFEGYDRMKTCLSLYHHSTFDDGISPPRKINVELTAGGGGKTKHRQMKIGQKNYKLNEERSRRFQTEKSMENRDAADTSNIHPSRRAQLQDFS